jgi:hypothetical protein
MPTHRSWLVHARHTFSSHVDRLQDTLTTLTERLRDTIAEAVSGSVASAIRETVRTLFTDQEPTRAPPSYYQRPTVPSRSYWDHRDRYEREEDEDDSRREEWRDEESRGWREVHYEQTEPAKPSDKSEPKRTRFHNALAVGCQAAAWWLRRQASRASALAAFGIGLVTTMAAFIAGIGLAESALHLLSLADAVRSGTHALAFLS